MLPLCAELPLMLLFSMLCTDDDGNVVDMRMQIDQPEALGLQPTLFGFHRDRAIDIFDTDTSIKTQTFSSSNSNNNDDNDDDNNNNNNNSFLPYCDLEHSGTSCFDRQDDSSKPGFFECRNGDHERDYEDCEDVGDHPDEQLEDENNDNNDDDNDDLERILKELRGD